jgi:hypothetical protein
MPAAGKKCLRPSYRDGLCIGCDERASSVAEFERERLRERTLLGLDRAKAQGKTLGRLARVGCRGGTKRVSPHGNPRALGSRCGDKSQPTAKLAS